MKFSRVFYFIPGVLKSEIPMVKLLILIPKISEMNKSRLDKK